VPVYTGKALTDKAGPCHAFVPQSPATKQAFFKTGQVRAAAGTLAVTHSKRPYPVFPDVETNRGIMSWAVAYALAASELHVGRSQRRRPSTPHCRLRAMVGSFLIALCDRVIG